MKLLILSTKLPYPANDGGAIATLSLAKGLAACGMDVTMLSFNTRKHFFPPENIPGKLKETIKFHTVNRDTTVKPVNALLNLIFSGKPYIASRFYSTEFSGRLREILTTEVYDIVQLEGPYFLKYIPVIRSNSSAFIALRAHNAEHEIWERRWMNENRILHRYYFRNLAGRIQRLEMQVIRKTDLLIAISERDRLKLLTLHPGAKSITIPTGIDLADYPSGSAARTGELCYIGALDWAPNQEGLRWFIKDVMPHLSGKNIRLHIAGRNAPATLLPVMSHPAITYHGEVEDAKAFISSYGIMIVPLQTGSGIRIKILEGMAMGKCIVTTSVGAEGIPATDGQHLLIADDGKAFAEKIINVINDRELSGIISAEARKLVHGNFDTFAVASRLGDYYKNLK